MTQVLLAFIGASLVITISPGPDTLLVLRNAAAGGRPAAVWTTVGILVGGLAWMAAVVAGLAALVRSSEALHSVLRYLGAAYLAYLGLRSLWGWWRSRGERVPTFQGPVPGIALEADDGGREDPAPSGNGLGAARGDAVAADSGTASSGTADSRTADSEPWWAWARQGLVTNLLNAKLGAFLVAFFPQFTLPGLSPVAGTVVLAAVFWGVALVWYGILLLAIRGLGPWLARPGVRRGVGGISGAILVAMAVLVAVGH